MNDQLTTQKTYRKRTAGSYLKGAEVSEMMAGTFEITIRDLPGCIVQITDNDDMIISDMSGIIAILECSPSALRKLESLDEEKCSRYRNAY